MTTTIKPLTWCGSSKEELMDMPAEIVKGFGYQLHQVQSGVAPVHSFPMKGTGGMVELRIRDNGRWFRVLVAADAGAVYVLRCFQKKSNGTPAGDLKVASSRMKEIGL